VDRYSFIVMDSHHLLLAGLPAHPNPDLLQAAGNRLESLRLLGRLPLKIDAARSGGRRPRSLDGGNRGPGWRVGAAPAAYLWGFEIGA